MTVNPRRAPGTHVLLVGHITPEELKERLDHIEMANGWGNRFLWFFVTSNKVMPHTRPIPDEVFEPFKERLGALLRLGTTHKKDHPVELDAAARNVLVHGTEGR